MEVQGSSTRIRGSPFVRLTASTAGGRAGERPPMRKITAGEALRFRTHSLSAAFERCLVVAHPSISNTSYANTSRFMPSMPRIPPCTGMPATFLKEHQLRMTTLHGETSCWDCEALKAFSSASNHTGIPSDGLRASSNERERTATVY